MRRPALACLLAAAAQASTTHHPGNGERIVVALVDGHVVTLDAWTGEAKGAFSSGAPLVRDHGAGVVPAVDGRIYQFDEDLEPRALPATAQELAAMDVPMMACAHAAGLVPAAEGPAWRDCGILTSHREKSIWAVDVATGRLQWVHPDDGRNGKRPQASGTPAFLQREEYTVAAMDARTGTERWSVGVASLSAFGLASADVSDRVGMVAVAGLLRTGGEACDAPRAPPRFPALTVAAGPGGYAVAAYDGDERVWTTDLPALPTEFFGASSNGAWSALTVTAPREPARALVAPGAAQDLLAHAVGRPIPGDVAAAARLAARVARAAGPPAAAYAPGLKLIAPPNATAALPLQIRRELLFLRALLVALALGAGGWFVLRRRRAEPRRARSEPLMRAATASPPLQGGMRATQSLSALGDLQGQAGAAQIPELAPVPELGPDALVSTARYEREFDAGERLGRGGFGTVTKATHKLDQIDYAIKQIRLSSDPSWRPRLDKMLREVKILALLDHPHIVRYYQAWLEAGTGPAAAAGSTANTLTSAARPPSLSTQAWTDDESGTAEPFTETLKSFDMCASDMPSLAAPGPRRRRVPPAPVTYDLVLHIQMQYCSSRTLRDYLDDRPDEPPDAALRIFAQIARGLRYVHERGLVHRDLKPANVFLIEGVAKIGDFGLSRHVGQDDDALAVEASDDADITQGVGTRLYAAPEQLASDDYDAKADVYSLGVVLYELLRPRFGTTMERVQCIAALARGTARERRALLQAELPSVNLDVLELVGAALARDPSARPSAADAASTIERALDADVVRQLREAGASTGDGTVILRAPNGDVRVYSDDGVFLSERPAGRSASEAVSEA